MLLVKDIAPSGTNHRPSLPFNNTHVHQK
jgi:hypothetical protein